MNSKFINSNRRFKNDCLKSAEKWLALAKKATVIDVKLKAMAGYHRNMEMANKIHI